ncbi:hypothetical protein B5F40_14400 [Gordonibacter sp. An230]|uniref:hypothetical protein n=1 Tax=Gordonibacter sp. An230 TaxID=1965592 RepID=UPI000B383DAA|nr:hypothetical protein [Gordonibacter sp. An230]OUO86986.1 hypothetical protein B5F40_14400 [Gordonibacter sp. An230]
MTHDSTKFSLSSGEELDEFDPLADDFDDEGAADGLAAMPSSVEEALAHEKEGGERSVPADERPAEERIDDLLASMAPQRKIMLSVLAQCSEPRPVAQVNALVDELQQNNFSVYSAANLCALLEKAGALERVTADGQPADDVEAEPRTVVVDGVEYLEAGEPVEICWLATDAGRAALEADKPLERLRELLDRDAAYQVIYKRILTLCSAEGGAKTPDINAAVDNDPLVQKPRFYAPHFVDKLEKCDALSWQKAWVATEVGRAGLEMLADVVDEHAKGSETSEDADGKEQA